MAYEKGHLNSTQKSKCIVCGKTTGTYLAIANYSKGGTKTDTAIVVPVCDEHYRSIADKSKILIEYAKQINKLLKIE